MRLDSHQHFWRYEPCEFGWIDDAMAGLRRDFLPGHLLPELRAAGIDGCIAVQARQSLAETRFLLDLAAEAPWIRGVVGWVDLAGTDVHAELRAFAGEPRLVGVRHIAQSEPDPRFLVGDAFCRGIAALGAYGLTYDLLVFPPQLPAAIELVRRFPGQRFVLDHCGKPGLRGGDLAVWRRDLAELARSPNVACKLSGLCTEADWRLWTRAALQPAFDAVLAAFGPRRLLYGSDWPVCGCATTYGRWWETVLDLLGQLAGSERSAVLGDNSALWYPLPPTEGPSPFANP